MALYKKNFSKIEMNSALAPFILLLLWKMSSRHLSGGFYDFWSLNPTSLADGKGSQNSIFQKKFKVLFNFSRSFWDRKRNHECASIHSKIILQSYSVEFMNWLSTERSNCHFSCATFASKKLEEILR